jgi:hypothetical protein
VTLVLVLQGQDGSKEHASTRLLRLRKSYMSIVGPLHDQRYDLHLLLRVMFMVHD